MIDISNQKVNTSGYSALISERNRYGGCVACYFRTELSFKSRNVFSNSIENVSFDLLIKSETSFDWYFL